MMNKLFAFKAIRRCPKCGNEDLSITTTDDRIFLSFNKILKSYLQNDKSVFNKYRFFYLVCLKCGAKYSIKWNGDYPTIYKELERSNEHEN